MKLEKILYNLTWVFWIIMAIGLVAWDLKTGLAWVLGSYLIIYLEELKKGASQN